MVRFSSITQHFGNKATIVFPESSKYTLGACRKVTLMNYFKGRRICKYCGINMDIEDLDILEFIHGTCWQQYRKNGEIYPMPANED